MAEWLSYRPECKQGRVQIPVWAMRNESPTLMRNIEFVDIYNVCVSHMLCVCLLLGFVILMVRPQRCW